MKRFTCDACGSEVYFGSTECLSCGRRLGFLPDSFSIAALEPSGDVPGLVPAPGSGLRYCANQRLDACNWLLSADDGREFCFACRHNRTVPDRSDTRELANWQRLELAKRHLFYAILRWHLPAPTSQEDPEKGLIFDFLADRHSADGGVLRVISGHKSGVITINIAEGDDAEREKRRTALGEPYRTLIGHFRHESGHYYWDRLVRDGGALEEFRSLFGDERADYGQSLQHHYQKGPPADWAEHFVSAYASAHPWEDYAETWSHYLHITDALETARVFHFAAGDPNTYDAVSAAELIDAWIPAAIAFNVINRSMGQPDLYPFVLPEPARPKLEFIHKLIRAHRT
jgi:hypothetical protein